MKRQRIINVTVLLVLLCATLPVGLSYYLAWRLALAREEGRLSQLAALSIRRTETAFDEAHGALLSMAGSRLPSCSPAHLAQMRALVLTSRYIVELGRFQQGRLSCTSWGQLRNSIPQTKADFVVKRGIAVTTRLLPLANPQRPLMALQLGDYNVLINPDTLADINIPPGLQLAIGTPEGQLLSSTGTAAEQLLIGATAERAPDDRALSQVLFGRDRRGDWTAVVTEPVPYLRGPLAAARLQLVPVGIAVALLLVGAVLLVSRRRLSPLARLEIAVQRREFIVHYQPIIGLDSGACVGAEALVRWQQPDGVLVPPDAFIPLAEESGLILPITDLVVAEVIRELGTTLAADPALHVAINVCAQDIKSGRVQSVLAQALRGTGVNSGQLWVEATERSLMDIDAARTTITHLRGAGHTVSIDDFGTGYSSLQYLQGLPLDALKIDKSFVDTIGTHSATSAVTAHIIEMAKTLRLRTIAEGVERQEQLDYLRAHGVDLAQGWLFSHALPATGFIAYHAQARSTAH
ncbi:TPA: EAL domain-containing protein [Xanthomonas vasicola pv. zeae]|uniref:cyclic-guanylate-specific phosphodiesterase n=2 Tax=Xanthomonas vasicola pv. vasculorum TaxID=325776 RepID=A0A836ZRG7_XANVA|nr:EAL domain-containing protein [Xanthomonas vasicola]KFA31218.1 membrane protein [Xanthomonas vasicola pv. musacearum NCPPB 4384]MBV6747471.1 EAL domain-containing protein [Xanthomonas vasicola pv. vasculorum NCPPB 890]AVQ08580.1 EAL domain-containing protein [Xanthomonas vasicola pv. vasculorum]AZM72776.1 EAL domain-containing protein [Xanthomonas vasicola pv. vasculorum]AZR31991.1 EAL domain-containing protein [Xanthomonas vasicola pv. musacearum NCPPB 4379]